MNIRSQSRWDMSMTENDRLKKRSRILLAAAECFIRSGFHATGMAEICQACGMSPGNLYRYFPNKDTIVQAIADEACSRIMPALRRLENQQDPVEVVVQIVLTAIREFCRDSDARLWIEASAEASRNNTTRKMWLSFDRELRDLLINQLRRATNTGQAPAEMDLEATSLWLVAMMDGAITRVAVQPEVDLEATLETLANMIRRLFHQTPV
jgi:AcrR family transcriptional regulator